MRPVSARPSESPQRRPPHAGEARSRSRQRADQSSALNEGLPTKGRRVRRRGREAPRHGPSTKASPRRGGETKDLSLPGARRRPQRRPPHEGEASWSFRLLSSTADFPQRRPPHEGEARHRHHDPRHPSTPPQRRPPHEGEASLLLRQELRPLGLPSTKASPRRGGEPRGGVTGGFVFSPSTKASPRRGGETHQRWPGPCRQTPQRRPPHEGEASGGSSLVMCARSRPSTKASPRRGGEKDVGDNERMTIHTLNEGLPTKGRRERRGRQRTYDHSHPQRRPPHEGEARKTWETTNV
ncbi:Uncharacterised protein [Rothia kristinae]|nr:Uncharacterised protein [Rothia kristinae]